MASAALRRALPRVAVSAEKAFVPSVTSRRTLMLQESHGMQILEKAGVTIPPYGVASTADEAYQHASRITADTFVVKAQVLAGGRGKGHFDSGLKGGVQFVSNPDEARSTAGQMIGHRLITKQTDAKGRLCEQVMVCKKMSLTRELYFGITMDRTHNGPVMIGSTKGGVNIEEVAAKDPSAIHTQPINIATGLSEAEARNMATKLGFEGGKRDKAADTFQRLYNVFVQSDANLLEINPMAEDTEDSVLCMDCKLVLDDNAAFRQKELFALQDKEQEDELELRASNANLNYIHLDGSIGCLVNGAGLAMATMDIIKLHGGEPANFLDVGGNATEEQVTEAFKIITHDQDKEVKSILVNIFGGIMRCDVIAQGIIKAATETALKIPVIVRLQGTKMEEAKWMFNEVKMAGAIEPHTGKDLSHLQLIPMDDLDEAAKMAVMSSQLMEKAHKVGLNVKFELPM